MTLRAPFVLLAQQLQEAADSADISHNDLAKWLSDACQDMCQPGEYCYMMDFIGDGESGDVIYCCNGDTWKAPYEIQHAGDKISVMIDDDNAIDVLPRTVYEEEADEDDHYASMESAKFYQPGAAKFIERFISKAERSKASGESFAGKGKSFPILKAADVMAAVRSMGRAGSENYDTATLKRNIIRIAKAKGFASELPKAWRDGDGDAKESAPPTENTGLKLVESASFTQDITIREAMTPGRAIKLISPGKGSSAYYTAEVLKKAVADKIFKAGTPMRIDHPTEAEQRSRPEGSVKDWGAVLAKDAYWLDEHPQGAGVFSEVKPFSDHAATIEEKGPYAGVSIMANGNAVMEAGKPVLREGVPLLKEFVSAEGVDMVTRAGAGGMFLSEAARPAENPTQEAAMTAEEVRKLVEAEIRQSNMPGEARAECARLLETMSFAPATKDIVIEGVMRQTLPVKDGSLDTEALGKMVVAEAQRIGRALSAESGGRRVFGMGASPASAPKPEEIAAREAREKADESDMAGVFQRLGMSESAAKLAAKGRAA